ncbi:nitroreductase [Trinickia dabaoshanensis]|uniref:Nitroreductase n=1 Tax=Trinickia dabaoshanensis TaxID=564714 RepID=A0A2N7VC39_9BURK|nr:nitroreductase family protein [Trinickia dabaoshanensis]PMS14715.1 nitroreductase [Trinickia dabaoshanensis]
MDTPTQDAWSIDASALSPDASPAEKLRFALHYAILAPSSHNTQPWRFIVDGETLTLNADRLRALPVADPYDRELVISCGAALFNLRVALSRFGLAYAITLFPSPADPDVLASLRLVPDGHVDTSLPPLFDAITARVTTRLPFSEAPIAPEVREQLVQAVQAEGAEIVCVQAQEARMRLAQWIAEADRRQFDDPRFRRELAGWIHSSRHDDGMPAYAEGISALLDFASPLVSLAIRTFDIGGGVAAAHQALATGSPLIACITTAADDAPAWLAAGQALERLLLTGVTQGLTASYLNQPIEVETMRERLRAILNTDGAPQLLLRLGHGPRIAHAPRRALADVLF